MTEQHMTVGETARALGVTLHHVYSLIWGGQLTAQKIGRQWRISNDAVEARLAERSKR